MSILEVIPGQRGEPRPATRRPRARGACIFPGITADAAALGVHRATLFKMLSGVPGFVGLKGLRTRYDALKRRQQKEAA